MEMMVVAVNTSETSVSFYRTTQCNIPEDNYVHIQWMKQSINQSVEGGECKVWRFSLCGFLHGPVSSSVLSQNILLNFLNLLPLLTVVYFQLLCNLTWIIFHCLNVMPASRSFIVYFWFHVEWSDQYLCLASIQSLVFYPALSAYFDIIKNERHGVHVTQLCQDADDDWLSLASNICFMTQHDRLLLAFFFLSLSLSLSHSS